MLEFRSNASIKLNTTKKQSLLTLTRGRCVSSFTCRQRHAVVSLAWPFSISGCEKGEKKLLKIPFQKEEKKKVS